jgi:hypothetical protein
LAIAKAYGADTLNLTSALKGFWLSNMSEYKIQTWFSSCLFREGRKKRGRGRGEELGESVGGWAIMEVYGLLVLSRYL